MKRSQEGTKLSEQWPYPCTPNGRDDFPRDCGHCDCPNSPCDGHKLNESRCCNMKQTCASCYKEFEPWNVVLLKPRYQEYTKIVMASLICRDCAKEEIEKGIIKEAEIKVLWKGFKKVEVTPPEYPKWLTDDLAKHFTVEKIYIKHGYRITKLRPKHEVS